MPERFRAARTTKRGSFLVCVFAICLTLSLTATTGNGQESKLEVPNNVAPHPAPAQPLPYSHKTHLALDLACANCHTNPAPGNMMTFPATAKCMQCHATVAKEKPAIKTLHEFARSAQPIPWVRVYQLTPGVNWSHRKHLLAGMECGMCHGAVSRLDSMAQATAVTAMASCIACHQAHSAPVVCATCHAWPSTTN